MKNILIALFSIITIGSFAQDKIVKKSGDVIECEVKEITLEEVKYTYPNKPNVSISIDKAKVSRIEFSTGEIEHIASSTFDDADYYADQNKRAVKISFLSQLSGSTEFSYEQSVKPGMSWEAGLGIIGLGWDPQEDNAAGAYVRASYKFMRSPDFYMHRMHYAHILKGAYIAPEIALRYCKYDHYNYDYTYYSSSYYSGPEKKRKENFAYAFHLKFGKQWVFSDAFLVDAYWGIGYGHSDDDYDGINYGFLAGDEDIPLSVTVGIKLGWTF